ncbi:hypothetical protein KCU61_g5787, partial [Aureobasidium melanogenum]
MSVEPDTIMYRFVEARTQKLYTFVLKAETPSHEIKLEAKWLFSDIPTRSLVKDIYLNLHADSCGSENFAWSFSWLEIKHDQNDAKLLLTNRSNEAKRKPGSSTPWKNTILGNGDILEFRCDFPKPPEGFSEHVGTCVFKITIERSRSLPTELEHLLQKEARFEPPMDNTHRAWRVACKNLSGRPLSRARRADRDPLSQPSPGSQEEETEGESNDPDARSHTDSGDHMEGPDESQAPTPASSHQAPSDSLKRTSNSHTQRTDDDRLDNTENCDGSTDTMRKRPRLLPDLAALSSTRTENTGDEGGGPVLAILAEIISVASGAKVVASQYLKLKGELDEVTDEKQTLKDTLAKSLTDPCHSLMDDYCVNMGLAIDENDEERQEELTLAAESKLFDELKRVNAPFLECSKRRNKLETEERRIEKALQESNIAYERLHEQLKSIVDSQSG